MKEVLKAATQTIYGKLTCATVSVGDTERGEPRSLPPYVKFHHPFLVT